MTNEIVELAKKYRTQLLSCYTGYWEVEVSNAFDTETAEKYKDKIRKIMVDTGASCLTSKVYIGGTDSLRKLVPEVLPSQEKAIISFLKENKRLAQIGTGKGKILVILQGNNLSQIDFDPLPVPSIPAYDPKLLIGSLNTLFEELEILRVKSRAQENTIQELQTKLDDLKHLQSQHIITTWS